MVARKKALVVPNPAGTVITPIVATGSTTATISAVLMSAGHLRVSHRASVRPKASGPPDINATASASTPVALPCWVYVKAAPLARPMTYVTRLTATAPTTATTITMKSFATPGRIDR
jgi:hypothetical protein